MADTPGAGRRSSSREGLPIVWRVSRVGLLASQIVMVASGTAIAASTMWVLVSPEADRLAAVLVTTLGVATGIVLWRTAIHPAILATEDALVIRNPLETVSIRWPDIVEIAPGFDGVTVTSVSSPPKAAWAVQKSNLSTWRGAEARADVVAARLWEIASERGGVATAYDGVPLLPQRGLEPYDAVRRPLRLPWRMTRAEASVIGFLRHSSSPLLMAGAGAVFGGLGLVNAGSAVVDQWDGHLLAERGVVVEATVIGVPGLLEVTWPAIRPETIFLETNVDNAVDIYAVGQDVEVLSDPRQPTRARLIGFEPEPWGSVAVAVGALFLASGYLKWSRWLVVAHGSIPPHTPPGRRRAGGQP